MGPSAAPPRPQGIETRESGPRVEPSSDSQRDRTALQRNGAGAPRNGNGRFEGRVCAASLARWSRSDRLLRCLNVAAAGVGLLVAGPLMATIAALIKLTSPGPVLYAQTRVGLDRRNGGNGVQRCYRRYDLGGRPFLIYKFRSMHHQPDGADAQVWAQPDDPRITPLGRFLRKTRIDELPQLFNVLRGEMNLVGPRPEQPEIFAELRESVEGYAIRQRVHPGITGWAQVNHRYDRTLDDVRRKVQLDLEYIARRSLRTDIDIMVRTVPTVLLGRGAW